MTDDQKNCACCGMQFQRRTGESRIDFRMRKACSRSCGAKLRRGVVIKPRTGPSIHDAMAQCKPLSGTGK